MDRGVCAGLPAPEETHREIRKEATMRRLSCSVLVGVLVVAAGALAEEALACTVTVQPGQSIQAAIAGAQEGAVICLGEGSWQENLKIEKALTLRGQGAQKTVIDGIQGGYPVVWVVGVQPIEVKLEGLEVTGAEGECADWPICASGMLIQGTARAEITNSTISGNWWTGIVLRDSAQAEITNNLIRCNRGAGIASSSDGPVTGSKNRMQENGVDLVGNLPAGLRLPLVEATKQEIRLPDPAYPSLQHAVDALLPGGRLILARGAYAGGVTIEKDLTIEALEGAEARLEGGYAVISLVGAARVKLTGLLLTGGRSYGLAGGATVQVEITGSTISESENDDGIVLLGTARAKITGSTISENEDEGIGLRDSAQAEITTSTISDNGADGILLLEKAILRLTESHLLRNQGYGVSAHLPGCVEDSQSALRFTGEVSGRGNTIPGPAEPEGNKKGAVCPAELAFLMTKEGGRYP
jgi:parallel beta-helix repeat protein